MSENPLRGCTKPQVEAFEAIATGGTGAGFYPKTLAALERKGLIEGTDITLSGRMPVRIRVYQVPIPVHIRWCEWCAFEAEPESP